MTATATQDFVSVIKEKLTNTKVFVFCDAGTLPLEWPRDEKTGERAITDDDKTVTTSGKIVSTNKREYRNIETRNQDAYGLSDRHMVLDTANTSHPFESDAKFLARIEDWLENSNDPRIAKWGVRIDRGNPYPAPLDGMWDRLKPATLVSMVADLMTEDHADNLKRLESYVGYELNRRDAKGEILEPRQEVLDGLNLVAQASGDEASDDLEIVDASYDEN